MLLLVAGCKQLEVELECTDGNWSLVGYIAGIAMQTVMGFVVGEPLGLPAAVALGRAETEYRPRNRSQSVL